MNSLSRRRALALAGVLGLAASGGARAQVGDPAVPIRGLDDALLQIMHAGKTVPFAERARLAGPAIEAAFDLPQILKTSIGPRWSSLPMPQQIELTELFRRYTIASYVANFDGFSGQKFVVEPKTRAVGADQVVATQIVSPGGDATRIDYVMRQTPTGWKAVDVLLDGSISRVAVQRSDFRALVKGNSAEGLITSLRTKVAALEAGGNA